MAGVELLVIAAAVGAAYLFVEASPTRAAQLIKLRRSVMGLFAIAIALILINTESLVPVVLGAIVLFFGGLWVFTARPWEAI